MLLLRKRLHDRLSEIVMWIDYSIYLVINFFRFKQFPKIINKIIVVEMYSLGDLLVATPVFEALKKMYPSAKVDALVMDSARSILDRNKNINKVLAYKTFTESKNEIKKNAYDLGIILHPGSFKVSLLLLLSGVKYRIGCAKSGITYGKGFFLNNKIRPRLLWQHKIEDNLDVVRSIAKNEVIMNHVKKRPTLIADKGAEQKILKVVARKKQPVVVIHPGSKHKTQRWYPERFAAVADYLIGKYKSTVIFTGSEDQKPQVSEIIQKIRNKVGIINLTGKTSFDEFVALLKNVNLVISIDTSTIHIASAFNVPIVALFGPTIPVFWGPTSDKHRTIWKKEVCVGCRRYECIIKTHECMRSITVNDVIREVQEIL